MEENSLSPDNLVFIPGDGTIWIKMNILAYWIGPLVLENLARFDVSIAYEFIH
jgi:hypothetical protein